MSAEQHASVRNQECYAAGVLPYTVTPAGKVLVLLGAQKGYPGPSGVRRTRWSDFGGKSEPCDVDCAATAGREFAEETLGLFHSPSVDESSVADSARVMSQHLRDAESSGCPRVLKVNSPGRNGCYSMYLAHVAFIEPLMFKLATEENSRTLAVAGAEKRAFAWVSGVQLMRATRRTIAARQVAYSAAASPNGNVTGRRTWQEGSRRVG
ncbi:hypothetical protein CYMTET_31603 [Cymbomonas tetramitiformis]|uniref:Nudix hydrolase domain-containing protein n=1 Tax=Cymbomonas tetramitiformis TaxID=36881 RepID=A0AAE0KST3_9CHLO|nr:hypothetical protein CYMTET_31603 [Cymbomonas tetramitiformis]